MPGLQCDNARLMPSSFSNLSLAEPLARAVAEMGYEHMTPIQAQAIPVVLTGKDVMGAAQTGTGKTAAFSLPLLQRMLKHENASTSPGAASGARAGAAAHARAGRPGGPAGQAVRQVHQPAQRGGVRRHRHEAADAELKKGVEVLVATPGRLLDHIEAKNAVLNQVEYVVLDEADRMLDIGFLPDLQRILSYLPKQRTTLLFSATFSPEIKRLANSYLQDPVTIEVARPERDGLHRRTAFLQRVRRREAPCAQADRAPARLEAGLRVRQQQARLRAAGALAGARGHEHHRPARRQEPGRAPEGAGRLQGRRGRPAGRHRRGRARPGHQGRAGGVQLRRAVQRRGLRAPHRPHRPRRRVGPGRDLRLGQRRAPDRRHREAAQDARSSSRPSSSTRTSRAAASTTAAAPGAKPARWAIRATCSTRPRERAPRAPQRRAAGGAARSVLRPALPGRRRTEAAPAWEAGAKPAASRVSANIKPKRKVAALFKSE